MNISGAIFDLDGTLSNSGPGITKSVQYALEKMGIVEKDLRNLEHFVGPPLKTEFMKTYGLTDSEAAHAVSKYRQRYMPIGIYETELYPGTKSLLNELKNKGKYIAIATSKPQHMAEEVLRFLEIDKYFDNIMGADLTGPKQSKSEVLEALFQEIDIKDKSQYIMIGDTFYDVDGANNVGIECIGVSYGYGRERDLLEHGAVAVAHSTNHLLELLA